MIVSVLLLPLFFALTGMRTRLDMLNSVSIWLYGQPLHLQFVAIAGKDGRNCDSPRAGLGSLGGTRWRWEQCSTLAAL